jgi:hypothetical protein
VEEEDEETIPIHGMAEGTRKMSLLEVVQGTEHRAQG